MKNMKKTLNNICYNPVIYIEGVSLLVLSNNPLQVDCIILMMRLTCLVNLYSGAICHFV